MARVKSLTAYGRPIICTEYMARSAGSTIDTVLPIGKRMNVGMINWGFVNGKTQTDMPWDSWQRPYVLRPPVVWFHDLSAPRWHALQVARDRHHQGAQRRAERCRAGDGVITAGNAA